MVERDRNTVPRAVAKPVRHGNRKALWRSGAEDEGSAESDERKTDHVVDRDAFLQPEDREQRKDRKRDNFLNGLELRGRIDLRSHAVRGDCEHVFEESDAPACDNRKEECAALMLEMPILGESHENIGDDEHQDRPDVGRADRERHDCS